MTMLLNAPNSLYCTHCRHSYAGGPEFVTHPKYDNIATWLPSQTVLADFGFLSRVKTCPHAGQRWGFPEAVRIMDEVRR